MSQGGGATFRERPVIFTAGDHTLFGVLTEPLGVTPRGIAVLVLPGGAYICSINRNRLSVHLTRRLAAQGFHGFRFDYHGVGESTGTLDGYWLDRPFDGDLLAAVDTLKALGLERILLVGSCFGARTILAASDRIGGLEGAVLISTPVRDFKMGDRIATRLATEMSTLSLVRKGTRLEVLRKLLSADTRRNYARTAVRAVAARAAMVLGGLKRPDASGDGARGRWISRHWLRHTAELVNRRVPVVLIYGTEEDFYREFQRARPRALDPLLEAGATLEVETLEGAVHGFSTLAIQDAVLARTQEWIIRRWA